ncbi:uncharacterized protein TM35_000391050 [Trypanosoma theileri]|uniref:Uncharacterized protein n=1 Tax=Trypanosoma theileri TaxID=67003 RepID=A0A1X0NK16_9TRYP|nr:uncharacterized protein TM35_000391050 [Trypanosoma theileri]ORC84931.1 hypothetical protein TM35_000391050 [Trypanosoma theileri]
MSRGLNCSTELSASGMGDNKTQKVFHRTVDANQQMLNYVKERENRSSAAAALFRNHHFRLTREASALEAEIHELNTHSRTLTAALREKQLASARRAEHVDTTHAFINNNNSNSSSNAVNTLERRNTYDDSDMAYKQLQQQLLDTSRVRDDLQQEVERLQLRCNETMKERAVLLRLLTEQRESLEPLLREAEAMAAEMKVLQSALETCKDHSNSQGMNKRLLKGAVSWSVEEELSLRQITTRLSNWCSEEDEMITGALRLTEVEKAVRFYQTWNNVLTESLHAFSRECEERRARHYARIREMKSYAENAC